MKRLLLLLLILSLTTIASSDTVPPVSIHLELAKDTLALAEPTVVAIQITNCSDSSQILFNEDMFELLISSLLSFTLITPEGEEWKYEYPYEFHVWSRHNPVSRFWLPSGETVSDFMFLSWFHFFPENCHLSLKTLTPGRYKLFASYCMPFMKNVRVGSDTIDFFFQPLQDDHLLTFIEMDSLGKALGVPGIYLLNVIEYDVFPVFERIINTKSPYAEAIRASYITYVPDYDLVTKEKATFDTLYLDSQFEPVLLQFQLLISEILDRTDIDRDSLLAALACVMPNNRKVLLSQKKLRLLTPLEASKLILHEYEKKFWEERKLK